MWQNLGEEVFLDEEVNFTEAQFMLLSRKRIRIRLFNP
jgi:hypothetical protein